MSVTITETNPIPSVPATELSNDPIFELCYKHTHTLQRLNFQAPDFKTAIALGNQFCAAKRLRFITVTPFLQDIKALIAKSVDGSDV
jgi:hypothetical protein